MLVFRTLAGDAELAALRTPHRSLGVLCDYVMVLDCKVPGPSTTEPGTCGIRGGRSTHSAAKNSFIGGTAVVSRGSWGNMAARARFGPVVRPCDHRSG